MEVKHIGIFGRRNAGKSSLINALLGQDVAIVSDKPGTTTDPVKKRMEIFGVGPVQLIDTAGIDDYGDLGEQRVNKTLKVIGEVDMGLLLFTNNIFSKEEMDILVALKELDVPVCIVHNKSDLQALDADVANDLNNKYNCDVIEFSCNLKGDEKKDAIDMLEAFIIKGLMQSAPERTILQGLVNKGDKVVLVCPIDSQAPSQRLILPQVMAIRDILDNAAVAVVLQPEQLPQYISENKDINLVVTDSQIFKKVSDMVPSDILLTSFSVLMARMKGPFDDYLLGVKELDKLKDGDKVLILESCTHRSTCEDI
ncbi:MAG: [Bacteroidales bacterium]|nr:[FeFe] hydrogenase H-cluster maturation GTPase HydF [Bacteroidales bacterium]